jgi:Zn-dependent peptidase ImmA (M78 family)/transcriptional regulator with XRE-family HTH domain
MDGQPVRAGTAVNPHMLAIARESRALSQTELAAALGVTQGKISKYEAGFSTVSDADLDRLANILEYPKEFFFLTDNVLGLGSCCIHHRKRQSLPVKELRAICAIINVARFHVGPLLAGVDIGGRNSFHRMDVDEYESPEAVAKLVRTIWQLPMGPIRSLVSAVENAGGIVFQFPFGTDKIDAVSQWPRNMPPMFFINKDLPVDRWRFSLAHELGHVIMHAVPPPDAERQADRFASELLLPAREIVGDLNSLSLAKAARLKMYWRVSMQAIIRRAKELKAISDRHYRSLQTQMSKLGYRKDEPAPLSPEEPTVIRDTIKVHCEGLGYDVAQLSALTRCTEHHFRRLFLCDGSPRLRVV